MNKTMWDAVINLAVKFYHKQVLVTTGYTPEDAMTYALEQYDTGYDLTQDQWDDLLYEIKLKLMI